MPTLKLFIKDTLVDQLELDLRDVSENECVGAFYVRKAKLLYWYHYQTIQYKPDNAVKFVVDGIQSKMNDRNFEMYPELKKVG